jgi:uncharacterized membrane protein
MTPLTALNVTLGCTLVSIVLSLYMTLTHYVAGELPSWCTWGSYFSCSDLLRSDWALLLGTPIALLGLAWNVVLLGLATSARDELLSSKPTALLRAQLSAVRLWLFAGVVFVVYLVAVEAHVGKICLLCTGVHVATLLSAYCVWPHADWTSVGQLPVTTAALVALLMLAPVVVCNVSLSATATAAGAPPRSLIDCLEAKKVEIIGHAQCAVCRLQTTFFENAARLLRVVEMTPEQEAGFLEPLWLMDGRKVHQGLLTVHEIKLKFNC